MTWTAPRTWVVGELMTASLLNVHLRDQLLELAKQPRGVVKLVPITATQGSIVAEVAVTGASITYTVEAGRRYRLKLSAWPASSTTADHITLRLKEGAAQLQQREADSSGVTATYGIGLDIEAFIDAAATVARTFTATAARASGTGTVSLNGSAAFPMLFYLEDVGLAV